MVETQEKSGKRDKTITVDDTIIFFIYMMWICVIAAAMSYLLSFFWNAWIKTWEFVNWNPFDWFVFILAIGFIASFTGFVMLAVPRKVQRWIKKKIVAEATVHYNIDDSTG